MNLFDIIIPVYNAQKSLNRCLNSLMKQTYKLFNVWMIDDGSVDNSASICREYSDIDKRFIYIRQNNAGPSAARNTALDKAESTYVVFLDSDDYVHERYLEWLLSKYQETDADTVFIAYHEVDYSGNLVAIHQLAEDVEKLKGISLVEALYRQNMFGNTWIKSFKRTVVDNVRFREGMHLFEDELFTCTVLAKCKNVAVLNYPVYYYVVDNKMALTKRTHKDYCIYRDWVFEGWKKLLDVNKSQENRFLNRLADIAYNTCKFYYYEHPSLSDDYLNAFYQCGFLKYVTIQEKFKNDLVAKKLNKLAFSRKTYLIKVKISRWLR